MLAVFRFLVYFVLAIAVIVAALAKFRNITWKDWSFMFNGIAVKQRVKKWIKRNGNTAILFEQTYKRFGPSHPAINWEGKTYTLGDIEAESNKIAHFALANELKCGDTIALYMMNKPQYVMTWLGFCKVGVRSALINYNLKLKQLLHSIEVSNSRILVFGNEVADSVKEVLPDLQKLDLKLYCYGGSCSFAGNFEDAISKLSPNPVPIIYKAHSRGVQTKDPMLYIYTSGTTGLPKAALFSHHRFYTASQAFTTLYGITSADRVFCALPLYHSAGGAIGVGILFQVGALLILKQKFSASTFWKDVRASGATVVQYIGEVCRYTLTQPAHPEDSNNQVRLALGNGLRPDIWPEFQRRFNIKQIGEFYAATEGPAALFNTGNKQGAIGFISPLVRLIFASKIVKFDVEKEELIRDSRGFCIECQPGEYGEFLAKVEKTLGVPNFSGYTNEAASNKKLAHNVFAKGDVWFRSGDLLKADNEGFVFFVDRIGDTFRWKGENVATLSVAEVMTSFPGCEQVNVYGVEVKGQEGRCGMATITGADERKIDWVGLGKHVCKHLPTYSRPYFVRIMPEMDITGTFKFRKVDLQQQGYNPSNLKDPLFFLNGDQYVRLDKGLYDKIESGQIRF